MVSRRAELNKDLLEHTFEITSPTGECASKVTFTLRFSVKTNETTIKKYSKTIANSTSISHPEDGTAPCCQVQLGQNCETTFRSGSRHQRSG